MPNDEKNVFNIRGPAPKFRLLIGYTLDIHSYSVGKLTENWCQLL